jgi:biopolymer transport protein TolR
MTMQCCGPERLSSEINVTPMIDVLLVLLIIFMVITPILPHGETARLPQPAVSTATVNEAVVLEVLRQKDGTVRFTINQQELPHNQLASKLYSIYATRSTRVLFLKGDDQLSFNQIADVIDIGHAAGVDSIGLMTPQLQAAH